MKNFTVIFHAAAEADISSSYEWGARVWGKKQANAWGRELHRSITTGLTSLPLSCSVAPESRELGIEIRQLVVERYRVLFVIGKKTVMILHVRGPFVPDIR